jgi:hypothetical protein
VQYSKQDLQQAKAVLIATKPLQAVRDELYREFSVGGDPEGDLYRRLALLDSVWKHFMIAIDNAKE